MSLRILFTSNAPWASSGYGTQANLIGHTLRDLGAEVAYFAYWGLAGGIVEWDGFPVYPAGILQWGDDIADQHARHFKADLILGLQDVWPLLPDIGNRGFPWVPLVPVDSSPVAVQNLIKLQSAYQVAAISKWGQAEFKAAGVDAVYLPHGFNPNDYYPDPTDRGDLKEKLGFPRDSFLVGMVAANQGGLDRKSFGPSFDAFAQFAERHPEARLYLHSLDGSQKGGMNLTEMAVAYGIAEKVRFVSMYYHLVGSDPADMRRTFSAFDVLMAPSMGEGFGIPVIEAQAAGCPVIVSDFSAQPELCGAGWLVKPARKVAIALGNFMVEPSVDGILEGLEAAYTSGPNLRQQAATFAKRYAQPNIQEKYWKPWLADMERRILGPAAGAAREARGHPPLELPEAAAEPQSESEAA